MEMTLEEYKKQLEEIAKGHQFYEEILAKTPDEDWQELQSWNLTPTQALNAIASGLV
jgi:hypothetical protein